jgi:porphyrinogen peroxidase
MPWNNEQQSDMHFVSFGKSFEAFELQLARMAGAVDGQTDALFTLSQPVTGSYFWYPPAQGGRVHTL